MGTFCVDKGYKNIKSLPADSQDSPKKIIDWLLSQGYFPELRNQSVIFKVKLWTKAHPRRDSPTIGLRSKRSNSSPSIRRKTKLWANSSPPSYLQQKFKGQLSKTSSSPFLNYRAKDSLSSSSSSDRTGKIYLNFEEAFEKKDYKSQVRYLEQLGNISLKKKDFTEAAHLFNGALAVAEKYLSNAKNPLLLKLEKIEFNLLKDAPFSRLNQYKKGSIAIARENLVKIRQSVADKLKKKEAIQVIQRYLTEAYQDIIRSFFKEGFKLFGEPHNSFSIIALGSMSRQEMCPYSDAEFAILFDENAPHMRNYFRSISRFLEVRFINLGETKWDVIRPKRQKNGSMREAISLVPGGFSMDIGGLSPIGKKGVYELIGTPQELGLFQSPGWLRMHDGEIILVNAMATTSHIMGDKALTKKYHAVVKKWLDQPIRQCSREQIGRMASKTKASTTQIPQYFNKKQFQEVLSKTKAQTIKIKEATPQYFTKERLNGALSKTKQAAQRFREVAPQYLNRQKAKEFFNKTKEATQLIRKHTPEYINREKISLAFNKTKGAAQLLGYRILLNDPIRTERAISLLRGHLEEFKPYLEAERIDMRAFNVKKDFYRPVQMILGSLSLYHGLKSTNSFERIKELEQREVLSQSGGKKLREILEQILCFRVSAHLFYKKEQEILYRIRKKVKEDPKKKRFVKMSVGSGSSTTIDKHSHMFGSESKEEEVRGLFTIDEDQSKKIIEIYKTLLPLHQMATNFSHGNIQAFQETSFYEVNVGVANRSAENKRRFDQAESLYTRAVALNPDNLDALSDLQRIKMTLGEAEKALKYSQNQLRVLAHKYSNTPHIETVIAKKNIALAYTSLANYNCAGDVARKALKEIDALLKEDLPRDTTIKILKLYAVLKTVVGISVSINFGMYKLAISDFNQALDVYGSIYGNSPQLEVSFTLTHAGVALKWLGDNAQALSCFQKALQIQKTILGNKPTPETAELLNKIGELSKPQIQLKNAQEALKALKILFKDRAHPLKAESLSNIGAAWQELGDIEKAFSFQQEALKIQRMLFGKNPHIITVKILSQLGLISAQKSNPQQALKYHEEADEMHNKVCVSVLNSPGPKFIRLKVNLANTYYQLKEYNRAIEILDSFWKGLEDRAEPDILRMVMIMANSYRNLSKYEKASTFYEKALKIKEKLYGPQPHPDSVNVLCGLSTFYKKTGELFETSKYAKQAYEMQLKMCGANHPKTKELRNTLLKINKNL
ncbi:tetratricopeptide repeat protein [Candidatus Neptunochlamydia vexilliferae]|nr:tetratricopeptide repeat protein [Candidatus Neptunochlamydia vexilliferae]